MATLSYLDPMHDRCADTMGGSLHNRPRLVVQSSPHWAMPFIVSYSFPINASKAERGRGLISRWTLTDDTVQYPQGSLSRQLLNKCNTVNSWIQLSRVGSDKRQVRASLHNGSPGWFRCCRRRGRSAPGGLVYVLYQHVLSLVRYTVQDQVTLVLLKVLLDVVQLLLGLLDHLFRPGQTRNVREIFYNTINIIFKTIQ